MKTLYACQEKLVGKSVESLTAHKVFLNSSGTGCGKSLMSVEACRRVGKPGLVICPLAVVPSWRKTFAEQGVGLIDVVGWEKLRTGKTSHGRWDKNKKDFIWTAKDCVVIMDECHRAAGRDTKNSRMMLGARRSQLPLIMCSATAAEDPTDMYALGACLGLHNGRNYVTWALEHGCEFDPWGALVFTKSESLAKVVLETLNREIYVGTKPKGGKLTREDMAGHFAETTLLDDPMDFGPEISRIYESEMGDELEVVSGQIKADLAKAREKARKDAERKGEDVESAVKNAQVNSLTRILRMRQKVELCKVPAILELIADYRAEHYSVVVFVNFDATLDAVLERIKEPVSVVRGGQSPRDRNIMIENFQRNAHRIMVCNIQAGGVGTSLHDEHGEHPRVSIISPSFDAKELEQTLGRIDRAGSKTPSIQRLLIAAGTVEEKIMLAITDKLRNLSTLHQTTVDLPSPTSNSPMSNEEPLLEFTEENPTGRVIEVPPGALKPQTAAVVEEEPAHAEFGPSSLKYFEIAPMYRPDNSSSNNGAAEKGTRIHLACETGELDTLVDEERAMAEKLLSWVDLVIKRHGFDRKQFEDHKEIRLGIETPSGVSTFGTCDRLLISANEGVMIDYKTGRNAIDDAEVNCQTQAYVAGAFQKFPQLQKIHFYFLVPAREEILYAAYERSRLPELLLRVSTIILRAKSATTCNPQPGICDFCAIPKRPGGCKHLNEYALTLARKYQFPGFTVPDQLHSSEVEDPEQMSVLLTLARLMKDWSDAVKFRANKLAFDEGQDIPGFAKVSVSGRASVLSTIGAYEVLKDDLSQEDFMSCTSLDMGKLEELVASRAPKGMKGKVFEAISDKLTDAGILARGEGSYQLRVKRK